MRHNIKGAFGSLILEQEGGNLRRAEGASPDAFGRSSGATPDVAERDDALIMRCQQGEGQKA